jgi:parallel beta-helix repeat protein
MIKNSWGTDWGASGPYPGCAWVAYGAANIGDRTSAIAGYKNPGDIIFYHDECGWMGYTMGYSSTKVYGAVRFTPAQNSTLTAVDFWAVNASMTYEIKVFDTLTDVGDGKCEFSTQLGTTQTETTNEKGYYSIQLDTPVQLECGNNFIVQVNITTTESGNNLPIDYYTASSHSWLPAWSGIATFSGESYCSLYGSQFTTSPYDIGIRARTVAEHATTYNEAGRYIEGTNVSVNTTGAFNRSYNVTGIPLMFQINNTLNATADSFTITNQTGLTTNGTSGMSNDDWFWVNATTAGIYGVNVTNDNNVSEYVNFTVVYYTKGAWNDTDSDKTHDAGEPFWGNIQDAIDNTNAGSTIAVHNGTYTENVDVSKQLTIQSESGFAVTVVKASISSDHVFEITADYVNISGFTAKDATGIEKAGIYLGNGIDHCNISYNNATNNYRGIYLLSSSYSTLTNNTLTNNNEGIWLFISCNYNNLTNNTASNNTDYDFYSDVNSHSNTVGNLTISSYPTTNTSVVGGTDQFANESVSLNPSAADGQYNVTVTMYDNASNYNVSYQNDSVVKDDLPTVTEVSPADESTGVAITTTISATFSEAMNTTSVEDAFSISPIVTGTKSWAGNKMVFRPNLAYSTPYTMTINASIAKQPPR